MAENRELLVLGEKYPNWLEANWRFLVGLSIWVVTILIIFFTRSLRSSDRIQAVSVITLVFITWFYAVQTQKLVKEQRLALEEERKKRYAEFGIERMEKFLRPLLQHVEGLKDSVSLIDMAAKHPSAFNLENDLGIFQARIDQTKEFFIKNLFMTDPILRYGYLKITKIPMPNSIERQSEIFMIQWKANIDEYADELVNEINNKISGICQNIRRTYGFFSDHTQNSKSRDDLSVLSDRPPTRS
jgi:hypothetical protein